jgi:hypothetical protein
MFVFIYLYYIVIYDSDQILFKYYDVIYDSDWIFELNSNMLVA